MMAADTRCSGAGPLVNTNKLARAGTSILGMCGDAMMGQYFFEWFKTPKRNPAMLHKALGDYERCDILIVELNPTGIFLWDGWGVPLTVRDQYYAVGSGSMAAMAEMRRNKKRTAPVDAVKLAMSLDEYTGGDVVFEELTKGK